MKKSRSLLLATTGIINLCSPIFGAAAEGSAGRGLKSANVAPKAFAGARVARSDGKDGFGAMFGVSVPFWQDASKLFSITPIIDYGDKNAGGGVSGSLILGLYALQAENVISFRVMVTADNASSDAMLPDGYTKVNQNRVTYTQVGFGFGFDSPVFGLDANAYLASHNKAEKFASKSTLKQKTFGDPTTAAQGSGRLFDQFLDEYLYGVSGNVGDVAVYANIAGGGRVGVYGRYTVNISASTKKPDEKGYHPATPGSHEVGVFANVGIAQVGPFVVGVQSGLRLMRRNDMKDVVLAEEREWKTSGTVGIFAKMGFNKHDSDTGSAGKLDHLFCKVPNPFATKLHVSVNASAPYSKERIVDSGARAINISTNGLQAGSAPTNSAGRFAAFDSRTGFSSAWWNNAVTNPNGVEARYLLDQGIATRDAAGNVSIAPNVFYAHTVKVGTSKSDSISSVAGVMAAIISERALVGELSTQADLGITTINVLGGGSAPKPGGTNGAFDVEQYANAEEVFVFGNQAPVNAVEAGKNEVIKKLQKDGLGRLELKNLTLNVLANLPAYYSSINNNTERVRVKKFMADNKNSALMKTLIEILGAANPKLGGALSAYNKTGEVEARTVEAVTVGEGSLIAGDTGVVKMVNTDLRSAQSVNADVLASAIKVSPLGAVLTIDKTNNRIDPAKGSVQKVEESSEQRAKALMSVIRNSENLIEDFRSYVSAAREGELSFQKEIAENEELAKILDGVAKEVSTDSSGNVSERDGFLDSAALYVVSSVLGDKTASVLGDDPKKAVGILSGVNVQSGVLRALGVDDEVQNSLERIDPSLKPKFAYDPNKLVAPMEQVRMFKEVVENLPIMDNDSGILDTINTNITARNKNLEQFEQAPLRSDLKREQDKIVKRMVALNTYSEQHAGDLPSDPAEQSSLMDLSAPLPNLTTDARISEYVRDSSDSQVKFWGDNFSIPDDEIENVERSNSTFGVVRDVFRAMANVWCPGDTAAMKQARSAKGKEFLNAFAQKNGYMLKGILGKTKSYTIAGVAKPVSAYDALNAELVSAFVDKYVDDIIDLTHNIDATKGIATNAEVVTAKNRAHEKFSVLRRPFVDSLNTHDSAKAVFDRLVTQDKTYATSYFKHNSDVAGFDFHVRQLMAAELRDNYKHDGALVDEATRQRILERTSGGFALADQAFKNKLNAGGVYGKDDYSMLDIANYDHAVHKNTNTNRVGGLYLHEVHGEHGMVDVIASQLDFDPQGAHYAENVKDGLSRIERLFDHDEVLHTLAVHGVLPNQLVGKGIDTTGNAAANGYVTQVGGNYVPAKPLDDKAVQSLISVRTAFKDSADYKQFVSAITSPTAAEIGLDAWKRNYIAHQNQLDRLNSYTGVTALVQNRQGVERGSLLLQIAVGYQIEKENRKDRTVAGDDAFRDRVIGMAERYKNVRESLDPNVYSFMFADMDRYVIGIEPVLTAAAQANIDDIIKFAPVARALFWDPIVHEEHYSNNLYRGNIQAAADLRAFFHANSDGTLVDGPFAQLRTFLLDQANANAYNSIMGWLYSPKAVDRHVAFGVLNAVNSLRGSVDTNGITPTSVKQWVTICIGMMADQSAVDSYAQMFYDNNHQFRSMLPENHFDGAYGKIRHVMRFWEQVASGLQRNRLVEYQPAGGAVVSTNDNVGQDYGRGLLLAHLELSRWRYGVGTRAINPIQARQNAAQYLDYCVYGYDMNRNPNERYRLYADLSRATVDRTTNVAANNYRGFVNVTAAVDAAMVGTNILIKHQKEILNIRLMDSVFQVLGGFASTGVAGVFQPNAFGQALAVKFIQYMRNDPNAIPAMTPREKSIFSDALVVAEHVDEASYLLANRVLSDASINVAAPGNPVYADPTDANRTPYGVPYNNAIAVDSFINTVKEASRWFIGSDNLVTKGFNTHYAMKKSNDVDDYAAGVPEAYKHMRASMAGNMTTAALGTAEYTRDIAHVVGTAAGAMHWFSVASRDNKTVNPDDARKMGLLGLLSLYYAPGNKPIPSDGAGANYTFGAGLAGYDNACAGIDGAGAAAPHDVRLVTLATVRSLITQSGSGDLGKVYVPHIVSTGFQEAAAAKGGIIGMDIEGVVGKVGVWDPANGAKANDIANASQWALMPDDKATGSKSFYEITLAKDGSNGAFNPLSAGAMLGSFMMKAIRVQGDEKTFLEQNISVNATKVRDYNLSLHTAFVNAGIGLTCARVAITADDQFDGHYALANSTPVKMEKTVNALGQAIRGHYDDGGGVEANLSDNPVFHGTLLGAGLALINGNVTLNASNTGAASIVATKGTQYAAGGGRGVDDLQKSLFSQKSNFYGLIRGSKSMNTAIGNLPEFGKSLVAGEANTDAYSFAKGNVRLVREALLNRDDSTAPNYIKGYLVGRFLEHISKKSAQAQFASRAQLEAIQTALSVAAVAQTFKQGAAYDLVTMDTYNPEIRAICKYLQDGAAGAGVPGMDQWMQGAVVTASYDAGGAGGYAGVARTNAGAADAQRVALQVMLFESGALKEEEVLAVMADVAVAAAADSATANGLRKAAVERLQALSADRALKERFETEISRLLETGQYKDGAGVVTAVAHSQNTDFAADQRAATVQLATLLSIPEYVGAATDIDKKNVLVSIAAGNPKLGATWVGAALTKDELREHSYDLGFNATLAAAIDAALSRTTFSGIENSMIKVGGIMPQQRARVDKAGNFIGSDPTVGAANDVAGTYSNDMAYYENLLGFDVGGSLKSLSKNNLKKWIAAFSGATKDAFLGLQNRGIMSDGAVHAILVDYGSHDDHRYWMGNVLNLQHVGFDEAGNIESVALGLRSVSENNAGEASPMIGLPNDAHAQGLTYASKKVYQYGSVAREVPFMLFAAMADSQAVVGGGVNVKNAYNVQHVDAGKSVDVSQNKHLVNLYQVAGFLSASTYADGADIVGKGAVHELPFGAGAADTALTTANLATYYFNRMQERQRASLFVVAAQGDALSQSYYSHMVSARIEAEFFSGGGAPGSTYVDSQTVGVPQTKAGGADPAAGGALAVNAVKVVEYEDGYRLNLRAASDAGKFAHHGGVIYAIDNVAALSNTVAGGIDADVAYWYNDGTPTLRARKPYAGGIETCLAGAVGAKAHTPIVVADDNLLFAMNNGSVGTIVDTSLIAAFAYETDFGGHAWLLQNAYLDMWTVFKRFGQADVPANGGNLGYIATNAATAHLIPGVNARKGDLATDTYENQAVSSAAIQFGHMLLVGPSIFGRN